MSELELLKLHADVLFHHDLEEFEKPQKDIVKSNLDYTLFCLSLYHHKYLLQHQEDATHVLFLLEGFACECWVGSSDELGGIYHIQNHNIVFSCAYNQIINILQEKTFPTRLILKKI